MSQKEIELLQLMNELKEIGEKVSKGTDLEKVLMQYEEKLLSFMINYPTLSVEKQPKT